MLALLYGYTIADHQVLLFRYDGDVATAGQLYRVSLPGSGCLLRYQSAKSCTCRRASNLGSGRARAGHE